MATEFDESDWILATADDDTGVDDWIVADGADGSVSGVFFLSTSDRWRKPSFASFGRRCGTLPDPSLSFFPPSVSVRSSSRGLVLLCGPWSSYYVCNPATAQWTLIPRPPQPHSMTPPLDLVLVSNPNADHNFHLICAFESHFETFSAASYEWVRSPAVVPSADRPVPRSGVSGVGAAYWKTPAPAVLALDPASGKTRILSAPPHCDISGDRWQLGEAAGQVCSAVVTEDAVELYALDPPSDRWTLLGSFAYKVVGSDGEALEEEAVGGEPIICKETPRPLRFESANLEVVLWVNGRILAIDLEARWVRAVTLEGDVKPGFGDDFVAHINTLASVEPPESDDSDDDPED